MTVATRASAAMAATGTAWRTGRRSATLWTRLTHDQALKIPATAATTGHSQAGTTSMAALARLKARNARATPPTAFGATRRCHQSLLTGAGWMMKATRRAAGTAARNSQDTGTAARPKSSVTLGESRTAASAVAKRLRRTNLANPGRGRCAGQAKEMEAAVMAPRRASTATSSPIRAAQELL